MPSSTILNYAKHGRFDDLKRLVDAGESFSKEEVFNSAVQDFRTVKRNFGHNQILKFVYDLGLTITSRIGWMNQPILCACAMYGNQELIEYIISKETPQDVFSNASLGNLPFFQQTKNIEGIESAFDQNGFNPLHYCAASSIGNIKSDKKRSLVEIASILVKCRVNSKLVVKNNIDLFPVILCAWFGGNELILEILIKQGVTQKQIGNLSIEFALEPHQRNGKPYFHIAQKFIELGWDINFIDSTGRTLLHGSANRGSLKPTQWLLEHGANVNALDGNGKTPMHVASERNTTLGVIELLINYGSEINKRDNLGRTALFYAKLNNRNRVVEFLEGNGARE